MIAVTTPELIYGIAGLVLGGGAIVLYSLIIGRGAKAKAQLILDEAQRAADAKIKDGEVAVKEMELKREADAERKLSKFREEMHQRERALDKRETAPQSTGRRLEKTGAIYRVISAPVKGQARAGLPDRKRPDRYF